MQAGSSDSPNPEPPGPSQIISEHTVSLWGHSQLVFSSAHNLASLSKTSSLLLSEVKAKDFKIWEALCLDLQCLYPGE